MNKFVVNRFNFHTILLYASFEVNIDHNSCLQFNERGQVSIGNALKEWILTCFHMSEVFIVKLLATAISIQAHLL